jgi:stress-induced morphogen
MSVENIIREKLERAFSPSELVIENDSGKHAHHAGAHDHLGRVTGETHFRLRIVSASFEGKRLVDRHREVNAALKEELQGPVHALAIKALTPAEAAK